MIVFSNTTPLIALAGINRLDLLQAVFGRIIVLTEGFAIDNPYR